MENLELSWSKSVRRSGSLIGHLLRKLDFGQILIRFGLGKTLNHHDAGLLHSPVMDPSSY